MVYKTFFHQLKSGENTKFTICKKIIDRQTYYFAKFVNIDLDFYKNLSEVDKQTYFGMKVYDESKNIVYYKNPEKLENDIKVYFGIKRLKSEID